MIFSEEKAFTLEAFTEDYYQALLKDETHTLLSIAKPTFISRDGRKIISQSDGALADAAHEDDNVFYSLIDGQETLRNATITSISNKSQSQGSPLSRQILRFAAFDFSRVSH